MGTFVFRWPHPADDVHVTGTFDDWGKSEQLVKVGDVWEKEVHLKSADEKILYKFVVDDQWITDHEAPKEDDGHYNVNNVLYPHEIKRDPPAGPEAPAVTKTPTAPETPAAPEAPAAHKGTEAAILSSAAVGSTTAALAGAVALEKPSVEDKTLSSAAPESTTAAMASEVPLEKPAVETSTLSSAAPESTTAAMAGEVPLEKPAVETSTLSSAAPESTTAAMAGEVPLEKPAVETSAFSSAAPESTTAAMAAEEPLERKLSPPGAFPETPATEPDSFNVAPIPATSGMSNPISLPAGEKVPEPSTVTANTVESTATTSKEGYEKDASAPSIPAADGPSYSVAPIPATSGMGNPISLPAGEKVPEPSTVTANTVESTATTSKEGYEKDASAPSIPAADGPSYSVAPIPATSGMGNPISLPAGEKVPDPSNFTSNTVESTATTSKEGYEHAGEAALGLVGGTAVGAAVLSGFSKPSESKATMIPESSLPMGTKDTDMLDAGPAISSVSPTSTTAALAGAVPLEKKRQGMVIDPADAPATETAAAVPSVPDMVKESMKEAHEDPEAAASAEAVKEKSAMESELLSKTTSIDAVGEPAAAVPSVPDMVKKSMKEAHEDPEAAASAEAVKEKSAMESELLSKTTSTDAVGEPAAAAAEQTSYYGLATAVPATVEKSMSEVHASPEAATEASVVAEKSAMEEELLKKVPSEGAAGVPAPTIAAATSAVAPAATTEKVPEAASLDASAVPASVSGGAEESSLANEPAVQMMHQHDAPAVEAAAPITEVAPTSAPKTEAVTPAATPAAPAATDGAADKKLATPVAAALESKKAEVAAATPKKTPVEPSASTPKKTVTSGSAASSPAANSSASADKEKKKKHRVSGFFKKIFN